MKILILGGTGLIGTKLCKHYLNKGFTVSVLTRSTKISKNSISNINYINELDANSGENFDVIINLAGEALNNRRWNDKFKKIIYDSRINLTEKLITYIENLKIKPKLLISGSAIGFYGNSIEKVFTEESEPKENCFTNKLCSDWEASALKAKLSGVRVCLLRLGVVLSKDGGALSKLILPFKLFLGTKIGNGKQWFSWIHIDDVVGAIDHLINNEDLSGPFNITAPKPVTNSVFSKELAVTLNRPCLFFIPNFFIWIMLGEMGEVLLSEGQKVLPKKLIDTGYNFKFYQISRALDDIINN